MEIGLWKFDMSDTPFVPSTVNEASDKTSHKSIEQLAGAGKDWITWQRTKSGHQYPVSIYDDKRIAQLRRLSLFNVAEDPAFARITQLAKTLFNVPFVALSFLDEHVQYLQAGQGFGDLCLTDRQDAICNFALVSDGVFVVLDLAADDNFALNSLVSGDPHLRFYAGVPVWLYPLDGEYANVKGLDQQHLPMRVATLCLLDIEPHGVFSEQDRQLLEQLGSLVSDALKLKQQQMIAKQANQIKSQFLANISHEIRTPMNGVMGMVEMLQETALNQEQQYYSHHIYQSCQHLLAIVNDVLDLSKAEAGGIQINPTVQSVIEISEEVSALYQSQAQKKQLALQVNLYTEPTILNQSDKQKSDKPCVLVDKVRLKQVLYNLLNNAIKFTPTHGTVSLQLAITGMTQLPDFDYPSQWTQNSRDLSQLMDIQVGNYCTYHSHVPVTPLAHQNINQLEHVRLHIQVCDTGIGIKPESLQVIFDAYNQADKDTHRFYGGTGLGLSVTKSIIKAMNGDIEVRSVVGVGTAFYLSLPVALVKSHEMTKVNQWLEQISTPNHNPTHKKPKQTQKDSSYQQGLAADQLLGMAAAQMISGDGNHHDNISTDGDRISPKDDQATATNAEKQSPQVSETLQSSLPQKFNRVLLVEDNAVNATIATSILTKAGHQVIHVTDGEHALQAYQRHAEHIVLILMDDRLPTISGVETTRRLIETYGKANLPPIIAVSANVLGEGDTRYTDAGMQDYLAKPFSKKRLQQMMEKWLGSSIQSKSNQ